MSKTPIIIGVVVLLLVVIGVVMYFTMMKGEEPVAVAPAAVAPAAPVVPPPPKGVVNVRYVRLERPSANYPGNIINLAEVEVFDENDVNVAAGKTVTGRPGVHGAGPLARLVDKNKTPANFAATAGNGASFMQIDLGSATTVKKIVITNRLNCCQDRTENMKVKLLDANNTVLKTTDVVNKGQKEMTMDFSDPESTWEYLPM
jgi:hypothetical protein